MKEKIYTIPVTEAFGIDSECPMCVLEKKLEDEYVEYMLGPYLMEPDGRIETNDKGFCRRHFELLYNSRKNMLGLGLIIDTHLHEQTAVLKNIYGSGAADFKSEAGQSFLKNIAGRLKSRQSNAGKFTDEMISCLVELEKRCAICSRLDYTMDRYIDVILYLWFEEKEFRTLFNTKKGFCLPHFRQLLQGSKKHLNPGELALFTDTLMKLQLDNLERIRQEVDWFTKKFDYRNSDASWGNSKDAVQRSLQKIAGFCNLK